jgi:hypothetical protein
MSIMRIITIPCVSGPYDAVKERIMKQLLKLWVVLLPLVCACSTEEPKTPPQAISSPATQSQPTNRKGECYDVGYQWGVCSARNTIDGSCNPETDVMIPEKCRNRNETQLGFRQGLYDVQTRVSKP